MKRVLSAAFLAVLTVVQAGTAQAYFANGNTMLDYCRSAGGAAGVNAYVTGAHDAYLAAQEKGGSSLRICVPNGASASQVRDVFCAFLEKNPQSRHETAASLLWSAIGEAWPCG